MQFFFCIFLFILFILFSCTIEKNLTGQLLRQLAFLRFKTVLPETEVLEFNTQLRTRLNVIAV